MSKEEKKFFISWSQKTSRPDAIKVSLAELEPETIRKNKLLGKILEINSMSPIELSLLDYELGPLENEISTPIYATDQYFSSILKSEVTAKYSITGKNLNVELRFPLRIAYEREFGEDEEPYKQVIDKLVLNNYQKINVRGMVGVMIETKDSAIFRVMEVYYDKEPPQTPDEEWIHQEVESRKRKRAEAQKSS